MNFNNIALPTLMYYDWPFPTIFNLKCVLFRISLSATISPQDTREQRQIAHQVPTISPTKRTHAGGLGEETEEDHDKRETLQGTQHCVGPAEYY
jgi:hypothetical protein